MAQYFTEQEAKTFVVSLRQQHPSFSFLPADMGAGQWIISMWNDGERIYHIHSEEEWSRFVKVCRCVVADSSAVSPSQA